MRVAKPFGDGILLAVVVAVAVVLPWSTAETHPLYRLNRDFDLSPEIDTAQVQNMTRDTRNKWQLRRYRNRPTFGLLENKLLAYDLFAQRYPKAQFLYGAFARKSLGHWPQYRRDEFIKTMSRIGTSTDYTFVLKPISSGASTGVLIMDGKRWHSEGWTLERLANHVEGFLYRDWSDYGQKYEHKGVVVEESLLQHISSELIEVKVHVVFGELAGGRLERIPHQGCPLDMHFCDSDEPVFVPRYHKRRIKRLHAEFDRLKPFVTPHTDRIRQMGREIADLYGADMVVRALKRCVFVCLGVRYLTLVFISILIGGFPSIAPQRLDVFVGANGEFFFNEVTYPSAVVHEDKCTMPWLLEGYQQQKLERVDATVFVEPLLESINVTLHELTAMADFGVIRHAEDAEYDQETYKVLSPEEKAAVHRANMVEYVLTKLFVLVACALVVRHFWKPVLWGKRSANGCHAD